MMENKARTQVTLNLPRSLYERLNEMRWQTRAPSFTHLVRDLLEDCADQYEQRQEKQPEMAQSAV
ncbi:MAG: hypothetical protein OXP66_08235 [Candidatus Tectomicrobia bacterium]|nr:hypothetical protein [Candidatus Tectomicrobia bacterium]